MSKFDYCAATSHPLRLIIFSHSFRCFRSSFALFGGSQLGRVLVRNRSFSLLGGRRSGSEKCWIVGRETVWVRVVPGRFGRDVSLVVTGMSSVNDSVGKVPVVSGEMGVVEADEPTNDVVPMEVFALCNVGRGSIGALPFDMDLDSRFAMERSAAGGALSWRYSSVIVSFRASSDRSRIHSSQLLLFASWADRSLRSPRSGDRRRGDIDGDLAVGDGAF